MQPFGLNQINGRTFVQFEDENGIFKFECHSLANLLEEWEDYEPKDPLIKEEKNRNVIRAWAKVNALPEVLYDKNNECIYSPYGSDNTDTSVSISFDNVYVFEKLQHRKLYTIEELCGEEEDEA